MTDECNITYIDELESPEEKLKALRQQIAIYQQQATELESQIAHDSRETRQRFMKVYQELADFAKTIEGLVVTLDNQGDIAITYVKNYPVLKHCYSYENDFPKKTTDNIKEELATAIAIIDQLYGKITFKSTYKPKALLNPIELADKNIIVSFDKQADGTTVVKAEKTTHTYKDGFITTLDGVTTLRTYSFDDDVSQTICDTRIITDFNQLYPLLKDMIRNINDWRAKTTIV